MLQQRHNALFFGAYIFSPSLSWDRRTWCSRHLQRSRHAAQDSYYNPGLGRSRRVRSVCL